MGTFLKYTGYCLLLIMGSAVLLDVCYSYIYANSPARNKVQYIINQKDVHIDYIFLGSSRTENHIDCELVKLITGKSCLNFGLQGSSISDAASILQIIIDNKITYDKVLLQVDYSLNSESHSTNFISTITPFISESFLSKRVIDDLHNPWTYKIPFVRYAANDKIIGVREALLQIIGKKPNVDLSNGFIGRNGEGIDVKGDLPAQVISENKEIIRMKELEPKDLVLFSAPYCPGTPSRDLFMRSLNEHYPENNDYVSIFDKNQEYFSDCGHLNKKGAQEFTQILTQDLLLD